MRIAVVQFPGSNCERETCLALKRAGMEPIPFLWNEDPTALSSMDGFVIVGGFSYEDRSRAGIIAALDPVMLLIKAEAAKGKPVLGICNGAQILVETGLVPGLEGNKIGMALTENKRVVNGKVLGTGYYNEWIHLRVSDQYQRNAFTRYLTPKDVLRVPVAHGEGRFVMPDVLLHEIIEHGLNVFQYCDAEGNIMDVFPVNPNGSMNNMAAVSNKAGNVMAIMPHPERTDVGDPIFKSMHDYIKSKHFQAVLPLNYYPRRVDAQPFVLAPNALACVVGLLITDNQALTVQNTLQQLGVDVRVKRYAHWELNCDEALVAKIAASGVLFNDRKEKCYQFSTGVFALSANANNSVAFLVVPKDDLVGLEARQQLADHYDLATIQGIKHGVLWQFESDTENTTTLLDRILSTHIIANPYAHDYYQYPITHA